MSFLSPHSSLRQLETQSVRRLELLEAWSEKLGGHFGKAIVEELCSGKKVQAH
ncbi:hypothetical protein PAXRUDRAFT_829448 [Paxillus rubicundulus Ve08.2h10]|uniref:Uncharacterized protein n=1 Tax=Paxillus rubicundulus Ve08.2h10 TaxID=930991 RepID=A0A0D0E040_9AGAM|nr:hypothetical protein PAXRUDRAFT_829448 [Paxillus rubicundulus Ve08.2h10]